MIQIGGESLSGELLQMPDLKRIRLGRLDPDETRNAIAAMWPQSRSSDLPELLDVMGRITAGVPLFIEEICQWMAENAGFTTKQLAKAASPSGASILETVLGARLEALGSAKEVARAAAVVGIRFNLALMREILPELGATQVRLYGIRDSPTTTTNAATTQCACILLSA